MKTITAAEWEEIMRRADAYKKFGELFSITCKKCGSSDVEIFGDYDSSGCFYPGEPGVLRFIVKCHACGNAKVFRPDLYMEREAME